MNSFTQITSNYRFAVIIFSLGFLRFLCLGFKLLDANYIRKKNYFYKIES